jgi:hypothetical protein
MREKKHKTKEQKQNYTLRIILQRKRTVGKNERKPET